MPVHVQFVRCAVPCRVAVHRTWGVVPVGRVPARRLPGVPVTRTGSPRDLGYWRAGPLAKRLSRVQRLQLLRPALFSSQTSPQPQPGDV